jgi:hypothetical protein
MLFSLIFLFALALHIQVKRQSKSYDHLIAMSQQVYTRNHLKISLAETDKWLKIYQVRQAMEQALENTKDNLPTFPNAVLRWAAIFEKIAVVRNQFYFTIEHFSITPAEAVFEGRAENDFFLDELKRQLQQLPFIQGNEGLRVLQSHFIESAQNSKLVRRYKFFLKFCE